MRSHLTALIAALAVAVFAACAGCGGHDEFTFDELDLTPAQDEFIEFPLGKYSVPIPLLHETTMDEGLKRNRVEFSFALYALVTADCKKQLANQWKRYEGKVRDRIILVCRNATAEELREPELATLKTHLTDAVHVELGSQCIRRLLVSDIITRKL